MHPQAQLKSGMRSGTFPNATVLLLSLSCIGFFLIFIQANAPATLDTDAVHYATSAKEIARSGRWLLPFDPVANTHYYYHFALSLWPVAVIFKIFGVSTVTAKLYAMSMALVAVIGIFVLGRMLSTPWAGWCAGMSFLLTDHVLRIARQCRPDIPAIAFMVWAFVGLILAQRRSRRWYLLFGAASLGAIMTREVVGLVPLVAAFLYFIVRWKWRELIHPAFIASLCLAIFPVFGWIWLEHARYGDTLWHNYYGQNFLHLMLAEHFVVPWYYYLWAIWDKYWYLLLPALAGAWMALREIRSGKEPCWIIVFLWAVAFPLGFSFARQKVHYYILPMYAATALFVGLSCERWIKLSFRPRILSAVVGLFIAGSIALACFPVPVHTERFAWSARIAPQIDAVISKMPGEVIVVRQDVASLLFYSHVVTRVTASHIWPDFGDQLSGESDHIRYCLIGYSDWELIDSGVRSRWELILDDGERVFVRQKPA